MKTLGAVSLVAFSLLSVTGASAERAMRYADQPAYSESRAGGHAAQREACNDPFGGFGQGWCGTYADGPVTTQRPAWRGLN